MSSPQSNPMSLEEVLAAARNINAPAKRTAWLDRICKSDPELRREVDKLLNSETAPPSEKAPAPQSDRVGPYKLLRQLSENANSIIHEAEQTEPVRRHVLLEVLKPSVATDRQSLARLDHPNIARLLDSGVTTSGRPYFASEWLTGQPIDTFSETAQLALKDRLQLFLPVCEAVRHAHRKCVVHGGLKPSNILIADRDGHPAPKIDFIPRQAEQKDLDTRADILSLGNVLHSLLPGGTTGDVTSIVAKATDKDPERRYETVNDLIRDIRRYLAGEPVEAAPPAEVQPKRKRAPNPASSLALAALLLVGIAVAAWFAFQSNRAAAEAATAQAVNRFLENDLLANQPLDPEVKLRAVLDSAAANLSGKFAAYPQVAAPVRLALGKAYSALGLYPEAAKQLDQAVALDPSLLVGETPSSLDAMDAVAKVRLGEGKYDDAEKLLRKVIDLRAAKTGPESPEILKSQAALAAVYQAEGQLEKARDLGLKLVAASSRVFGPESPETLASQSTLAAAYVQLGKYDEAEAIYLKLLEVKRRVLGPENPDTLAAFSDVAYVNMFQGKYSEAVERNTALLELRRKVLGPDNPNTLATQYNLAAGYHALGLDSKAYPIEEDVVERRKRVLGPDHLLTLLSIDQLASEYAGLRRYTKAEELWNAVIETEGRVLGPQHPERLKSMNRLAALYRQQDKLSDAFSLESKVLEGFRKSLGPEHPATLAAEVNLGLTEHLLHHETTAEFLLRTALAVYQRSFPADWQRYRCESILGASLAAQEKKDAAKALLDSGYQGMLERKKTIPADSLYNLENAEKWKKELGN